MLELKSKQQLRKRRSLNRLINRSKRLMTREKSKAIGLMRNLVKQSSENVKRVKTDFRHRRTGSLEPQVCKLNDNFCK